MAEPIVLLSERGSELEPMEWSAELAAEVIEIRGHRSVRQVRVRRWGFWVIVLMDFEPDQPAEDLMVRIHAIEAVALLYVKAPIGNQAPDIYIDRRDFPNNIPHMNPVSAGYPASPCVSYLGLQALYDRSRVTGVLNRLAEWFTDAQLGRLMADGWDPVPVPRVPAGKPWVVSVDMAEFQQAVVQHENAASRWFGGWCTFPGNDSALLSVIPRPIFHSAAPPALSGELDLMFKLPWLFVHAGRNVVDENLNIPALGDADSLFAFLRERDLETGYREGLPLILDGHLTKPVRIGSSYFTLLLVGFWRPQPLVQGIRGLSTLPDARRLEVRALVLSSSTLDSLRLSPEFVHPARIVAPPTAELYAEVSGTGAGVEAPIALVGCGALGSTILDLLLRSGHANIRVIDDDVVQPHNIARHEARLTHLGKTKAAAAELLADGILQDHKVKGLGKPLSDVTHEELESAQVLIDATADVRVQRLLALSPPPGVERIVRTEIFDSGRLGVASVSTGANPDLLDLYAVLCSFGMRLPCVEHWLRRDSAQGSRVDAINVGLSCSSPTVRLPKAVVVQHASAMFSTITMATSARGEAGVGLNPLSASFEPEGWHYFPVRPFVCIGPAQLGGWHVRLHADMVDFLVEASRRHSPRENGGYLYGILDAHRRRIAIVIGSSRPDNSKGSSVSLELDPEGSTEEERAIRSRIGRRLQVVGSWHSHPSSSTRPSSTDIGTLVGAHRENAAAGWPTAGLIVGRAELTVAVVEGAGRTVRSATVALPGVS